MYLSHCAYNPMSHMPWRRGVFRLAPFHQVQLSFLSFTFLLFDTKWSIRVGVKMHPRCAS